MLLTSGQYQIVGSSIANKNVIHFKPKGNEEEIAKFMDSFWFRLGYHGSVNIVVTSAPHDVLTRLVYAGLLYDFRSTELPTSVGGVYDLFHETLFGESTRIYLCNQIREVLANREGVRWCGAETESVFNATVYHNSTEICGNTPPGQFYSLAGGRTGSLPNVRDEPHLRKLFQDIISIHEDPGQRKLALIMYAIPRVGFSLIYIGGSPGAGWMLALKHREYTGRVLVIDPAECDTPSDIPFQFEQVPSMIESWRDLERILDSKGLLGESNLVFIWDVRHSQASQVSDAEREGMILHECAVLNSIINTEWFANSVAMYQLKINVTVGNSTI